MATYQILLLTGNISIGDSEPECFKNSYSGFFTGIDPSSVIQDIRNQLREKLEKERIGALEFLIVDITDSYLLRSFWHDGHY